MSKVMANLEVLRSLAVTTGSPLKLEAHMTICKENAHEIAAFFGFAESQGFDSISFNATQAVLAVFETSATKRAYLRASLLNVGIWTHPLIQGDMVSQHVLHRLCHWTNGE